MIDNVRQTDSAGLILQRELASRKYTGLAVLVDEKTQAHCYPVIKDHLPNHWLIRIESGEEFKNLDTCAAIWSRLTEFGFDRKAILINLGGGVIGDMGGFCAATFKRGIDFINIPTTLLAQVDASIGGKLGIDFKKFKNHIGVFREPDLVIVDPVFLKTLDMRELRSGFAEVIKHALIADADYWPVISGKSFEAQDWTSHIAHSIDVKRKVVEEDPREGGKRKILNFGHTIGHAIESFFLEQARQKLLHGEAIAAGMICEAYLSVAKCGLTESALNEIAGYILSVYGKVDMEKSVYADIAALTLQDKKNLGGVVKASLLEAIGSCTFDIDLQKDDIIKALAYYQSL